MANTKKTPNKRNPVARDMERFSKRAVHLDRKKSARIKHKKRFIDKQVDGD